MTFTQIPQQYAPLGGELRYTVTAAAAGTIDLRITDTGSADLIGARRFAGSASVSFDAAPCLRRAIRFSPVTGSTGFHVAEGRCIAAVVEAGMTPAGETAGETAPANGEKAVSPERTFLPRRNIVAAPALLTAMPSVRTISPGESDELTLLCDEACTITVTAQAGDSATAESYRTKSGGVLVFRLDTRDFPDAETLTVDAGKCGSVSYTVVPTVSGGRRLAWRSSAGSIEHYTFPIEKSVTAETVKDRAYGTDGHLTAAARTERRTTLVSAYETRAVLEALGEITASPEVWLAEGGGYTPLDVTTPAVVVHRHAAVSCLEIEIRSKRKTRMPWN
ncbi:hypothetical protein [Alistipes finegoldii]|mgnify:CR=1 FL=1|uniref:hypothetical protein n=1 Tax=Alistipes finegoldii TaxID=214856 RepID=UPI00248B1F57|nr:hypothetical protein [Alistipes finegoldii]